MAPPSARRAGRLFRHTGRRVPWGGRHGRAHGLALVFSGVHGLKQKRLLFRILAPRENASAGASWRPSALTCAAGPPAALSCSFARCIVARLRFLGDSCWGTRFSPRRASFYAARSLLRCATDLEKLCRKSHSNTSSVTRLTGRKMVFGLGLPPARASAYLSQKNLEVQRACGGARGPQESSPKRP